MHFLYVYDTAPWHQMTLSGHAASGTDEEGTNVLCGKTRQGVSSTTHPIMWRQLHTRKWLVMQTTPRHA